MTTLVVLFNLKADASPNDYEHWAKTTDLPIVRELSSVDSFDAFKTAGVLGSDNPAPYAYVEVIQVNDMETFGAEVGTDTMRKVASEFQQFADGPIFMVAEAL